MTSAESAEEGGSIASREADTRKKRAKKSGGQIFDIPSTTENTPVRRKRGRPPGSGKKLQATPNDKDEAASTPTKTKGKVLFPSRPGPKLVQNGSRKSHSKEVSEQEHSSDDGDEGEGESTSRKREEANGSSSGSSADENSDDEALAAAPSAKKPRKRRKAKSPTPSDLPAHERYFWENRPGRQKASNKPFTVPLLTHEQYHHHITNYEDPHADAYEHLHEQHTHAFPQWQFELSEDFNICLHGYGSKRRLVNEFAQYLHEHLPSPPRIFMVNGYTHNLNLRHTLNTLATLVYDCKPGDLPAGLGSQPRDILNTLVAQLTAHPPSNPIYIFINSLDAPPLRRGLTPALLGQLAAHPSIRLLGTCDTGNFPLLWDVALREQYNWAFHDATTFQSFAGVEIESVVDEVNELLGRSGRSIKGKGGAGFVLKSLPENARNLYRVLIAEILSLEIDVDGDIEMGEDPPGEQSGLALGGIERKTLYQKAVEEFICSNEMGFGQLLNEFYDHDMLVDRTDADGTRILGVPWRKEECEEILEELIG